MVYILKPLEDSNYLSPEEALKQLAKEKQIVRATPKDLMTLEKKIVKIDLSKKCTEEIEKIGPKNHIDWTGYFNERGEAMASMADIYRAARSQGKKFADYAKKVLDAGCILHTSTRIAYPEGTVTGACLSEYEDSEVIKPFYYNHLEIPKFEWSNIFEVIKNKSSHHFLQYAFGIEFKEVPLLIEALSRISNVNPENIQFFTNGPGQTDLVSLYLSKSNARKRKGAELYLCTATITDSQAKRGLAFKLKISDRKVGK